MKYLLLLVTVLSVNAYSSCSTRMIGSTAYTNCSDGTSYSARQIGGTTYYSGDVNATSRKIGGTTYYNGDVTGTSRKIGGSTYYNTNQGNYNSRNIGGSTYYSNGARCYYIGSTRHCN